MEINAAWGFVYFWKEVTLISEGDEHINDLTIPARNKILAVILALSFHKS